MCLFNPNLSLSLSLSLSVICTGNEAGRDRLADKLAPLLASVTEIESMMSDLLQHMHLLPHTGEDVVVMVVNDGELDLFFNFACSLRTYGLSHLMKHVMVFAGSEAVVPVLAATGAMALYHQSFGFVRKSASYGYLDRTFVDMMWYKAFSVWLVLKAGYNVLFQDVDLVWFRDPFSYFQRYLKQHHYPAGRTDARQTEQESKHSNTQSHVGSTPYPEAFFSDDGQRSLRYTPFYGNSGFYYLLHSPRTLHFAWSVVTSFDQIHSSGSHQNIFTMRMMEGLDLMGIHPKILSLRDFSTGVVFHHNATLMQGIATGTERPYNFHMCWTANKWDKLKYFKSVGMWFLKKDVDVKDLRPPQGKFARWVKQQSLGQGSDKFVKGFGSGKGITAARDTNATWRMLQQAVCDLLPTAPFQGHPLKYDKRRKTFERIDIHLSSPVRDRVRPAAHPILRSRETAV